MPSSKEHALIIVESPSKAKKISTYVPQGVEVMASVGHIRDLPTFNLGVAVSNHFAPRYEIPKDKTKIVEDLRKATKKVHTVYLASDPDREGESIAWHLYEVLKDVPGDRHFYRVRYNEVTKGAVLNALANPTEIDQNLVNAQQARRIEDRLSGFKISKLISSTVRGAKSAGRVQSVALRLIVDRERAVQAFRPTPFWLLEAHLEKNGRDFIAKLAAVDGEAPKFTAIDKVVSGIEKEAVARAYQKDLLGRQARVINVEQKLVGKRPQPPFITSTLQQAAATHLGYSPDQTMRIAQALYEEGLITYMRTDGFTVSASIRDAVAAEITKLFGKECVPEKPNFYGNKVKNAQEAHEPIRPTDVSRSRLEGVDPQQAKLYDLIWRRFVASQMAGAKFERTTVTFEPTTPPPTQHEFRFSASAQKVVFRGFLNVWSFGKDEVEEGDVAALPILSIGDVVPCREWALEAKETQPPARFNEASLVRAMEENGIGRPSTYAATIRTLLARDYVKSGRGHVLTPTPTGIAATDYLLETMPDFLNVEFTAQMEEALDKVAEGSLDWEQKVADFYEKLTQWLAADPKRVQGVLGQLAQVKQWHDPTLNKSGKVSWSDQAFYEEMQSAVAEGTPLSKTQLATLSRMAVSYREQLPELETVLGPLPQKVDKSEIEGLFKALEGRELTGFEAKFVPSVQKQFERSGTLSEKQISILRRMVKPEEETEHPENEADAQALLGALASVTTWNEPVKRGKQTYDDKAFIESLTTQLQTRHYLSERQFEALKKVVRSYQEQIPNYATLAETYAIKAPKPRAAKGATKRTAARSKSAKAK